MQNNKHFLASADGYFGIVYSLTNLSHLLSAFSFVLPWILDGDIQ